MKISKHFDRNEFRCKCKKCSFDTVDAELLKILELIRNYYNQPITITSACRCESHNKHVGGSESSLHLLGKAVDFRVKNVSPRTVYNFLYKYDYFRFGLGLYEDFVHFDVRADKARWVDEGVK